MARSTKQTSEAEMWVWIVIALVFIATTGFTVAERLFS